MYNFSYEYDAGNKTHHFIIKDGEKKVISSSVSEHKLLTKSTEEVIKGSLNTIIRTLNELDGNEDNE